MKHIGKASKGQLGRKLRTDFLAGFLIVVPLGATVLILLWIFNAIDDVLQPIIRSVVGRTISGVGFGTTIVLIFLIGVIASNVGGRKLVHYGESLLARVPLVRQLYTGIKQILVSFSTPGESGFLRVVLVEFPKKGMRAVGFVTNESYDKSGEKLFTVFIPTSPNPTSGYLEIVRETDIVQTDISIDDALKMVLSAGKVSLKEISDKLTAKD
jgi:uncharacterized membrane protein